jgi:Spy/CpxP family protein refolding chaperone
MKKSIGKALLGATMAGLALLSLSATSWAMKHGGGMDHDPARLVAHMTQQLDLSEEQQNQVAGLLNSSQEQNAADRERLQVLREQMHAQRQNFDSGEAQKLADEIGEITGRMVFNATKTHSEIYQLLTAEQRQEMDALMEKRSERRGKWRRDGKSSKE